MKNCTSALTMARRRTAVNAYREKKAALPRLHPVLVGTICDLDVDQPSYTTAPRGNGYWKFPCKACNRLTTLSAVCNSPCSKRKSNISGYRFLQLVRGDAFAKRHRQKRRGVTLKSFHKAKATKPELALQLAQRKRDLSKARYAANRAVLAAKARAAYTAAGGNTHALKQAKKARYLRNRDAILAKLKSKSRKKQ